MQNILFGLSPGFTNSLQLIPRWRFVVATMPHVMHCVAAMLQHRYVDFECKKGCGTITNYGLELVKTAGQTKECSLDESSG